MTKLNHRESKDDYNIPEINEHQKFLNDIRSYVNSFTSNTPEKREFSMNFFNRNKSNHKVYQALIQITDNLDEAYDLRLQTITILKKVFNKRDFDSYIKVKKIEDEYQNSEYYEKSNINNYNDYTKMLGDGVNSNFNSNLTDDYLSLMLPSAQSIHDLSLKEEDEHLLSHFGFSFGMKNNNLSDNNNNKNKNVKVSIIDSLYYIDQESAKSAKLQEASKKLIIAEMKNLPNLDNYKKLVDRHFDKYMLFDLLPHENGDSYAEQVNIGNHNNINNMHNSDISNRVSSEALKCFGSTKNYIESSFKALKDKKGFEKEKKFFAFKEKIETHFENPLPIKLNDEDNWKKLISLAEISMQHFNIYNFNLDLYTRYGPLVWKKYTDSFEALVNLLENERNDLKEQCDKTNKERKFNQVFCFS